VGIVGGGAEECAEGGSEGVVSDLLGGAQSGFCVTHENIDATELVAGETGDGSDAGAASAGGRDGGFGTIAGGGITAGAGTGVAVRALATTEGWRGGEDGVCAESCEGRTQFWEDALRAFTSAAETGRATSSAGDAGGGEDMGIGGEEGDDDGVVIAGGWRAATMGRGSSISSVGDPSSGSGGSSGGGGGAGACGFICTVSRRRPGVRGCTGAARGSAATRGAGTPTSGVGGSRPSSPPRSAGGNRLRSIGRAGCDPPARCAPGLGCSKSWVLFRGRRRSGSARARARGRDVVPG
jgi:hypothetical protein